MSNTCLITKLKSSVDNEDLNYFGGFKMTVETDSNNEINFAGLNVKVKILSNDCTIVSCDTGGTIIDEKTITLGSNNLFKFKVSRSGLVDIVIIGKYGLRVLGGVYDIIEPDGIDGLKYSNDLKVLNCVGTTKQSLIFGGSISAFKNSKMEIINFFMCKNVKGSFSDLPKTIKIASIAGSGIGGNIEDLGDLINLETVNIGGNASPVTGTIEGMVERFRANGITEKSLPLGWLNNCTVTFNGIQVSSNADHTVSWTADSIEVTNLQE